MVTGRKNLSPFLQFKSKEKRLPMKNILGIANLKYILGIANLKYPFQQLPTVSTF
jgi:hypothetical protein